MSWKKKGPRPIELIFQFDAPRNFTKITIFTSNLFHLGVQVKLVLLKAFCSIV